MSLTIAEGQAQLLRLSWPALDWFATCDADKVVITHKRDVMELLWDYAPLAPSAPDDGIRIAKYAEAISIIEFPLAETGPWSLIRCPAIFGVWLLNAIMFARGSQPE